MSVLAASAIAAGIGALSSMANNAWNAWQTKKTNQYNESLMRESWQREDNAVQRRVADLKAAGLSPVLAAGSAADSSGPITTQAPKSNFNIDALQALSLASSLKHEQAETDLLKKQTENFGKPDWYIALKEVFGAEKLDALLNSFGDKLYDWLTGSMPSGSGWNSPSPTTRPVPEHIDLANSWSNSVRGERPWLPSLDSSGPNSPTATFVLSDPEIGGKNYSLHVDEDRYNKLVSDMVGKGQGQLNNLRQRVFKYYSREGYTENEIEFIWECALKDSGHY